MEVVMGEADVRKMNDLLQAVLEICCGGGDGGG